MMNYDYVTLTDRKQQFSSASTPPIAVDKLEACHCGTETQLSRESKQRLFEERIDCATAAAFSDTSPVVPCVRDGRTRFKMAELELLTCVCF
jgi:hypothetical protein